MSKGNTHIPALRRVIVIVWEVSEGGGIGDGGRWVHEGEMERDGGVMEGGRWEMGDGRWRRNGRRGGWKGLGISKSLISF